MPAATPAHIRFSDEEDMADDESTHTDLNLVRPHGIPGAHSPHYRLQRRDIVRPTPLRAEGAGSAQPAATVDRFVERVLKQFKNEEKFAGTGKAVAASLTKYHYSLTVALDAVDATDAYYDILDLTKETTYVDKVNRHVFILLYRTSTSRALTLVEKSIATKDGRQAWKQLNNEYLPLDALSRSALTSSIHSFVLVAKDPPEQQLDDLERRLDTLHLARDIGIGNQERVDAVIAALSKSDRTIYASLVQSLNERTFSGEQVSIHEIRTLASAAFKTHESILQPRRGVTGGREVSAVAAKAKPKKGTTQKGDEKEKKAPLCKICAARGVTANHWHRDCEHYDSSKSKQSTSAVSSISKKATVTEIEDDDE